MVSAVRAGEQIGIEHEKSVSLGAYPEVTLAEARQKRAAAPAVRDRLPLAYWRILLAFDYGLNS